MLDLLGAEGLDHGLEFGIVGAQGGRLLLIVLVDDFLDGDRAGHRGLAAEQRRGGAEGVAGDMPERMQRGRAHAALADQLVEGIEMALLLRRHVADRLGIPPAPEHRELTLIDPARAIFAGLVDPDHAADQVVARQVARQLAFGRLAHAAPVRPRAANQSVASPHRAA